jgi:uncharacterized protein Smg (DUF494 family)
MFERIIEILVYLISELKQNKHIDDINLAELQDRGYTNAEISTAFSWLADRVELSEQIVNINIKSGPLSFRVLHPAESDLFTREGLGELIQLHTLGIITNEQIEQMIERAMMVGMRNIDPSQLKSYIAGMIFSSQSEFNYGSRIMLDGSDIIN